MPRMYRSMRADVDGKPLVEPSAKGLGVRAGTDVRVDAAGRVILDGTGMSVAPNWRVLPYHRRPERLDRLCSGSVGSNSLVCFAWGEGDFQNASLNEELALEVDSDKHGNVVPRASVTLHEFGELLAKTRDAWEVDER